MKHLISEVYSGWAYGFWQNQKGYLGQTPELVAKWDKSERNLTTAALAGTVKNSESAEKEILSDVKIRHEHDFVVEDIYQNLNQNFSKKNIHKGKMEVLRLKHLVHLKTDFTCTDISFDQAYQTIQVLHPTAALGIYPRDKSEMRTFSKMTLQNERLSFAAPFAMVDSESIHCVAAIRNFYFSDEKLVLISGCGVTKESIFEIELAELQFKRESVKRMMGLGE